MKTKIILLILFSVTLSGCSQTTNMVTAIPERPSAYSTRTNVVVTAPMLHPSETITTGPALTSTVIPSKTPPAMTLPPTYLNFSTKTPTPPVNNDLFLLKIVSPGPMSKVVSPIDFVVHIAPGYTGSTRIELVGEGGAILFRKILKTFSNIGYYTRVAEKISFEIRSAAEVARLQITTFDNNGRMQAINSVHLLLQSVGENELTPADDDQDRLLLRIPGEGQIITGGVLEVGGEYLPVNNLPVVLELVDINGSVLGSRLLQIDSVNGKYQTFATNIPFRVTAKTPVRLIFRQSDDRIDGYAYLFSLKLLLAP